MWRASYRGHAVAAKQLNAMSDLVGLDDALVELVNEVNMRFLLCGLIATRHDNSACDL